MIVLETISADLLIDDHDFYKHELKKIINPSKCCTNKNSDWMYQFIYNIYIYLIVYCIAITACFMINRSQIHHYNLKFSPDHQLIKPYI